MESVLYFYHFNSNPSVAFVPNTDEFLTEDAGASTSAEKLQAEYPGTDMESRQQLYEATQALYKENGVSMRASMIPLFIQMPILLALFQALTRVEALKVGHFLWLNLGEPDPFFILPIMAAVFTFLSSWLTNKSAIEKNMAMTIMTYVMPVMIFFFAVAAASGWLCIGQCQMPIRLLKPWCSIIRLK